MVSEYIDRIMVLLKGLEKPGQLAGFRVDNEIEARWYQNHTDQGVWTEPLGEHVPGRGRHTTGENIQFYGDRMVRYLPGGIDVRGDPTRLFKGYFVTDVKAGQEFFDYAATHEIFHTTSYSSRIQTRTRAESVADSAFMLIRKGLSHD